MDRRNLILYREVYNEIVTIDSDRWVQSLSQRKGEMGREKKRIKQIYSFPHQAV